jgi:pyruvate/2-oxoglutarate dehydrogenase complex dihydrolipoamide dehydrogenase (E3) component
MTVEYDLVVVGDTAAAATAAMTAAQVHARVAWVASPVRIDSLQLLKEGVRSFRAHLAEEPTPQVWQYWTAVLLSARTDQPSVAAQISGVHYVESPVVFAPGQPVTLKGDHGLWRARRYLLAMTPPERRPPLPGIKLPQVWSIHQLWEALRQPSATWPSTLAILGNGPMAVESSQCLQLLGIPTTIITNGQPLLPHEDREVVGWVQAYLEGNGVLVEDQDPLSAIEATDASVLTLTVGEHQYNVTALVLALESCGSVPECLYSLNLRQTRQGIAVDAALQTSIPSIYACGSLLGGYTLPNLAAYEAKLAVRNALFEQCCPVQYHQVPYVIFSDPPLARLGLTEQQAKRYDPQVMVLRQSDASYEQPLCPKAPAGFYKVLVQRDGTVLGVHFVSAIAAEVIDFWALVMQQGISLSTLDTERYASLMGATGVQQIAAQWQQQYCHRDRNERWFYKRRQQIQ